MYQRSRSPRPVTGAILVDVLNLAMISISPAMLNESFASLSQVSGCQRPTLLLFDQAIALTACI